ncbi:prepilin-type N-terminal cleavage/methylation domain-containing protein [Pleionea sp. CnH1-48]|uniref:prepilin-type N-terminal cleavage/methylation domain-containing protein n=1 Tax=Pleionea sp. CnH1-48 TaxID=2954494 RepID=UPI002097AC4F|nr:prepilin-type N-terminal cleavage/methylation domain-containing protein [Pleionea sp. CnH1-48]MCO7226305.1 prepilin-type N-terminal cleavage/methylation domain-containing protein [Pleionea sp. CnH1-48]
MAAFTLMELLIVIVIIGILSIVVAPRFSSSSEFSGRAAASELVSHLRYAQQLAMNNTAKSVRVIIGSQSVSIEQNLSPILSPQGDSYPHSFADQGVTFSPTATLTFNSSGEVSAATTIAVTPSAGQQVCIESTGYAWLCDV